MYSMIATSHPLVGSNLGGSAVEVYEWISIIVHLWFKHVVALCIAMPTMLAISGQLYLTIVTNHWMGAVYGSVLPATSSVADTDSDTDRHRHRHRHRRQTADGRRQTQTQTLSDTDTDTDTFRPVDWHARIILHVLIYWCTCENNTWC